MMSRPRHGELGTFDRTITLAPLGEEHRWSVDLDPGWQSLRGIHGGYLAAIVTRAFETAHAGRPVRTLHVSFVRAATAGPAAVTLDTIRQGTSLTVARVGIEQGGRSLLDATVTGLSSTLAGSAGWGGVLQDGPAERSACFELTPPPGLRHFDHARAVLDPRDVPFSGGPRARVAGYVTPSEPRRVDAPWLSMLLDWFPPSPFARHREPVGGVSIDYLVHVHGLPDGLPDDAWLTGVFEAESARGGLAVEHGRVADPGGRLLAESFHTRLVLPARLPAR